MFSRITNWTAILAGVALSALVISQFLWIRNSKRILEEQFDNKSDMALCSAVENLNEDCLAFKADCCPEDCILAEELEQGMSTKFDQAMTKAVAFYDLPNEWELQFFDQEQEELDHSCCSVLPMDEGDFPNVAVIFPARSRMIYNQMKLPILSSIIMILLVAWGFQTALRRLRLARETYRINQEFYNNIGHELRTPLTNIGLATKLLLKGSDQRERYLAVIEQETARMEEHTEKMLHLAAFENGTYQLQMEQINLRGLITEVIQDMSIQVQESGLQLKVVADADASLWADNYHLKNVISSLIDNCIKYGGSDPKLTIEAITQDEKVVLAFRDNGIGITPQDQKYVFDKYYRASSDIRGYGLGLPYVKMIVEAHKGVVRLISEVGKGSAFFLTFPDLQTTN